MKKINNLNPWEFRDNGEKVLIYVYCSLGITLGVIFFVVGIKYLIESQYVAKVPCSMLFFVLSLAFLSHGIVFLPDKITHSIICWFKRKIK